MNQQPADESHERPRCGAKTRTPDQHPCKLPPVKGATRCRKHGGATPRSKAAAERRLAEEAAAKAVQTYGLPVDVSPTEALLEEVRYTAGHVAWLRERVRELEAKDLVWGVTEQVDKNATEFPGLDRTEAARPNVWLDLYMRERKHLVDVTKAAISAGIEERRVKLAEAQGSLIAGVIRRILDRLDLTKKQQGLVPVIVPEELRRAVATAGN